MNGIKCLVGVVLVIGMLGCEKMSDPGREDVDVPNDGLTVQSTETFGGFTASMFTDGSLKLELREDGELVAETTVPADRVAPGNAVTGVGLGEAGYGPWCIVHCHVNPSTTMYVAWNSETGEVLCSPGYTMGMIRSGDGEDVFFTIDTPHFDVSPDPFVAYLYVRGVQLGHVASYGWKVTWYTTNSATLTGMTQLDEEVTARVTFAGEWISSSGKAYDVYHVYSEMQMMTEHSNVRGYSRVYFVRDGEVAADTISSGVITIEDNQLLDDIDGDVRPWVDELHRAEGL